MQNNKALGKQVKRIELTFPGYKREKKFYGIRKCTLESLLEIIIHVFLCSGPLRTSLTLILIAKV